MPISFGNLGNNVSDLIIKKFRALQLCGRTPAERLCKVLEKVVPLKLLNFSEDTLIALAQSCASSYFFTASLLFLPQNCPHLSDWDIQLFMTFPTQALTLSFCLQHIETLEPGNLSSTRCKELIKQISHIDKISEHLLSIERSSDSSLFEHSLLSRVFLPSSPEFNFSSPTTPPVSRSPTRPPMSSPRRV